MKKSFYQLVYLAKKDEGEALKLLEIFKPKMKKTLLQTSYNNREDLYQELNVKLLELIQLYDLENTIGFWDFKNTFYEK